MSRKVVITGMGVVTPMGCSLDTYWRRLVAGHSAVGPVRQFDVSPVLVQQSLTAYMVPFAIMTLWHGAISDALGRRRPTLVLLACFAAASIGCMCSWDLPSLMFFRALQGMTAGAGLVIGRAAV